MEGEKRPGTGTVTSFSLEGYVFLADTGVFFDRLQVSDFVEAFDCVSLFATLLFVSDREELFFASLLVPL